MVTVAQLRRHIGELLRLQTLTADKVEQLLKILEWSDAVTIRVIRDVERQYQAYGCTASVQDIGNVIGMATKTNGGRVPTRQQLRAADIGASDLETSEPSEAEAPAPKCRPKRRRN